MFLTSCFQKGSVFPAVLYSLSGIVLRVSYSGPKFADQPFFTRGRLSSKISSVRLTLSRWRPIKEKWCTPICTTCHNFGNNGRNYTTFGAKGTLRPPSSQGFLQARFWGRLPPPPKKKSVTPPFTPRLLPPKSFNSLPKGEILQEILRTIIL